MSDKAHRVMAEISSACLLFAAGAAAGMVLLIALFKLGVAGRIDILFYRGVVLCGFAFALTVALLIYVGRRTGRVSVRDAIAAGALSLGLNLSVLVIAPVTVDRSVSVFILGHMAAHEGRTFTAEQIETALHEVYFGDLRQVDRRMHEQLTSGNIAQTRRRLRHLGAGPGVREMGAVGRGAVRRRSAPAAVQADAGGGPRQAAGRVVGDDANTCILVSSRHLLPGSIQPRAPERADSWIPVTSTGMTTVWTG